jgi:hypothetical protein
LADGEGKLGPKMLKLNVRQRNFVLAVMAQGDRNVTAAAKAAGYASENYDALRVQASRLWHDERIQEAVSEEAYKRLKGLQPMAVETVAGIMENVQETGAVRLKAAEMLFDRTGFHAVTETINTSNELASDPDRIKRIASMLKALGGEGLAQQFMGRRLAVIKPEPVAVDAEFEEPATELMI